MAFKGQIGRADLVQLGNDRLKELAYVFGYQWKGRAGLEGPFVPFEDDLLRPPDPPIEVAELPLSDLPYWKLTEYEAVAGQGESPSVRKNPPPEQPSRAKGPAPVQRLADWAELSNRLRRVLSRAREGAILDIERIVGRISEGEVLERFPRKPLARWSENLQIISDYSLRLLPYHEDQLYVACQIKKLVQKHGLLYACFREQTNRLVSLPRDGQAEAYRLPPEGVPVLVMGDLGCLAKGRAERRFWLDFGWRLRTAGHHPIVLFPASRSRCPADLAAIWTNRSLGAVPFRRPSTVTRAAGGAPAAPAVTSIADRAWASAGCPLAIG